ncbi:hypothetical protein N7535_008482 [Penicillium sp. DV-2018c]|nr:hypothetical protein N7461_002240 [Penicillium sp. DV-2018c]KAJ5563318.1 hypothetical protein N7535_008482 [Penicillium sp. DV-2018c]
MSILDLVVGLARPISIAKGKIWYTGYISFNSWIRDANGQYHEVIGAGTIRLHTEKQPDKFSASNRGQIWLTNVLHCPTMFCNIIGKPVLEDYVMSRSLSKSTDDACSINNYHVQKRRDLAYFVPVFDDDDYTGLIQLVLTPPPEGRPVGPSPFRTDEYYVIQARWTNEERERLRRLVAEIDTWGPNYLREEEEEWLEFHDGGEEKFLANRGLNIDDKKDRAEGRAILRDIIAGKTPWVRTLSESGRGH